MKSKNLLPFILMGTAIALFTSIFTTQAGDIRSDLVAGQKAPPFHLKPINGKLVNFPDDYKGKIVMLDFWATWCGPCCEELPNVVANYQKYHDKGFDIVSVSLDAPRQGPALLQFMKDHGMTWPQIYDGGYGKTAVAVEYKVNAIPCPVIVDGDTGKILAIGVDAVGNNLSRILEGALAGKSGK
jgi:thiol-disulfide isomerase/thioredoxin